MIPGIISYVKEPTFKARRNLGIDGWESVFAGTATYICTTAEGCWQHVTVTKHCHTPYIPERRPTYGNTW